MEVSFASWPGSLSKANEDFVAASPSVAVVLDGLSAPPPLATGCLHGAPWFVAQLGAQVMSAATTTGEEPLQDLVAGAIMRVADSHAHSWDLDHPGTPSSSLAVPREQDQRVEYLLLFDSVIILDGPSGLAVVTDRRVDEFARQEDLATREHLIGSPAHQERVQKLVAAQRRHRNQPGGYWVARGQAGGCLSGDHRISATRPGQSRGPAHRRRLLRGRALRSGSVAGAAGPHARGRTHARHLAGP